MALATFTSVAETSPPSGTSRAPATSAGAQARSSLSVLAEGLASGLALGEAPLVVFGPIVTAEGVVLSDEARARLHERLRFVVGAGIAPVRERVDRPLDAQRARALARERKAPLVHVVPTLRARELILSVDVVGFSNSFWQRVRAPTGSLIRQFTLSVPVDAEVRRFLPPPPGLFAQKIVTPNPIADVVAIACGSFDDEGTTLALVGRRDLALGHFAGGSFVANASRAWADLAPLSPTPLRAPLAAAFFRGHSLDVASSDRAELLRLDRALRVKARAPRSFTFADGTCSRFSTTGFSAERRDCGFADRSAPIEVPAEERTSLSRSERVRFTNADGIPLEAELRQSASLEPVELRIRSPLAADLRISVGELGSPSALGDLDGDGSLEIVTTASGVEEGRENLVVLGLDGSRTKTRFEAPMGPIRAVALCPFEGKNPLTLVAATSDELWVFR